MTNTIELSRSVPRISLNRIEVACAIGVSANTVDLMVDEGYLPKPKIWHKRKVWLVADIQAAMAAWPEDGITPQEAMADSKENWRAAV